jgi:Na+-transporting NADH:ubiquinone oxidoreductase subunit NqrA
MFLPAAFPPNMTPEDLTASVAPDTLAPEAFVAPKSQLLLAAGPKPKEVSVTPETFFTNRIVINIRSADNLKRGYGTATVTLNDKSVSTKDENGNITGIRTPVARILVSRARQAKKASGMSGRQWRKARKAARTVQATG